MAPGGKMIFGPGDRIGDYEVLCPLGAGGMGSVYKVRHAISQRIEALKVILPGTSATPEMADRFLREIRLQASLEHPHIASLHNAFRFNNELVMVMEFVEGVSLRDKLRSLGVTLAQALEYASQVLSALAYAHAHGVVHRDIKPSNVMIASHGVVKLLDFGLAMSSAPESHNVELTLTQPGMLLGSPHYISPEQARGERADARSDVYSTGAMLYEMVAGRPPFESTGGAYAIIAAHLHELPRSPAEVNPHVPQELARIILKALAKDAAARFQTAEEFLAALKSIQLNLIQLDAIGMNETATVAMPCGPSTAHVSIHSDAELERVSKELAAYIGPIAQILVRRAAPENRTLQDLYHALAEEISSAADREHFLAGMPRSWLSRSAAGTPSGGSRTSG